MSEPYPPVPESAPEVAAAHPVIQVTPVGHVPPRRRWPAGDRVLLVVGIVLGVLLVPLVAFTAIVGVTAHAQEQARLGTTVASEDLVPGDCLTAFDQVGALASDYTLIDCDLPHAAELVYLADLGGTFDFYIGSRASGELAQSICDSAMRYQLYLRTEVDQYPTAKLFGVYQARTAWQPDENVFQCFLVNGNGEPLVGQYFKPDAFVE